MEIFKDLFTSLATLADKQPIVLLLLIGILVAIGWLFFIRKSANADNYDHNEKVSLIQLAAQTLIEQKEQRAIHERHQAERIAAQKETTNAVNIQNKAFRDYHVSIVDTIDLTHRETIMEIGGAKAMLVEIRDFVSRYPEMETKVSNILRILENMEKNQNV
jgi:hypothetical protein